MKNISLSLFPDFLHTDDLVTLGLYTSKTVHIWLEEVEFLPPILNLAEKSSIRNNRLLNLLIVIQ